MSILIKCMEMPKDCAYCPLAHWAIFGPITGCNAVAGKRFVPKNDDKFWDTPIRPDWCPLVEVPPHGDLIDRSELLKKEHDFGDCEYTFYGVATEDIEDAPTIIPAEEDKE